MSILHSYKGPLTPIPARGLDGLCPAIYFTGAPTSCTYQGLFSYKLRVGNFGLVLMLASHSVSEAVTDETHELGPASLPPGT